MKNQRSRNHRSNLTTGCALRLNLASQGVIRSVTSVVTAAIVATAVLSITSAIADVKHVAEADLTMDDNLSYDIHRTLYFLRFGHYSPKQLDDDYSSRILDAYLKDLDPNKIYFTKKDIEDFETYRYKLDDFIKRRNAEVAFDIFKVFRQRLTERTEYALELIDSDFNFEQNDRFNIDRDSYRWAATKRELEANWAKRIKNDTLQALMAETPIDEVRENLKRRYQRQLDVVFQLKSDEVFEYFMNAFTRDHGPHTTYMSHVTAENFDISMSLQLQGIGAALQSDEDYTVVNRIIKGGPAEKNGSIKPEDKIVAVGQDGEEMINVIGWRLMDVVQMIRGDKGTKVTLDVLPSDKAPGSPPERIELERDIIQLEDQAVKLTNVEVPQGSEKHNYAVISVPSFYSNADIVKRSGGKLVSTSHDVETILKDLKDTNTDGVILDLRGNGGGYLNEAVRLTGLFIDEGPVVQIVNERANHRDIRRDRDSKIAYDGPLVVLIDRYSASASEILAGALQDYGRALIVGERSFGKGTVQYPRSLRENDQERKSKIKFTNAQFFRISGSSTQHRGVIPDLILNSGEEDTEFGERSYDNALPWSETRPADYQAGAFNADVLNNLRVKHLRRTDTDPAFTLLRKRSARILDNKNMKSLSLNLEQRKQRRDRLEAESLEDLNVYRASLGLKPVTSDTLKDNPLPGDDEHWNQVHHEEAARILHDLINQRKPLVTKTVIDKS